MWMATAAGDIAMARQPRIDLAGVPQHLVQRGNNRQPCFRTDDERRLYLRWLYEAAQKYGGSIHSYVLMNNHVHLLATGAERGALGRMMQCLGRRYVRYFNTKHERTGTLWEGRYKSSLIDSDRYLLSCYRYIELNPVRARIVERPGDYPWSSYLANACGKSVELVTPHENYLVLGKTAAARSSAYRKLFHHSVGDDEIQAIRDHLNQGKAMGSEHFLSRVEATLNRRVRLMPSGRPRKNVT
jgi:REP-associated tyrosine transposase